MIKRIKKLKSFGIFRDFESQECPDFCKFNLIYGWNRSGKTTLSRVFSACEGKKLPPFAATTGGSFAIELDDGSSIKSHDLSNLPVAVRVFNRDFVEDNISFEPGDSCKPIVVLGADTKEDIRRLAELRERESQLRQLTDMAEVKMQGAEREHSEFLRSLGVEVATAINDKTFNKTKVEGVIDAVGLENMDGKILAVKQLEQYERICRGNIKEQLQAHSEISLEWDSGRLMATDYPSIRATLNDLVGRRIESGLIDWLVSNPDLNAWVEEGFELHKNLGENGTCLFCGNTLPPNLLDDLSRHFSREYAELQSQLTKIAEWLQELEPDTVGLTTDQVYPDLMDSLVTATTELRSSREKLDAWLDKTVQVIKKKLHNPFSDYDIPESETDPIAAYNAAIKKLNGVIEEHNSKVSDHSREERSAKERLMEHLIATRIAERNYANLLENVEECKQSHSEAKKQWDECQKSIRILQDKSADIGPALGRINSILRGFFGRDEIKLSLDDQVKGYRITRDGRDAEHLSEGEKTAIAFSYFVVKTKALGVEANRTVVFIDDPISSLDSNYIYNCFALIKSEFVDFRQLFVATHNFEFFNLVKDWFHCKERDRNGQCAFLMIEADAVSTSRSAVIGEMDETLRKHRSEYHYLFNLLNRFVIPAQPGYRDLYTIGNIARRFLEIFLSFKVPKQCDMRSKLRTLTSGFVDEKIDIDEVEVEKVYRLVQEHSHSQNPTSSMEHKDRVEVKAAIQSLLKIVEVTDPAHYRILKSQMPQ